jgi:hypothetical protein
LYKYFNLLIDDEIAEDEKTKNILFEVAKMWADIPSCTSSHLIAKA